MASTVQRRNLGFLGWHHQVRPFFLSFFHPFLALRAWQMTAPGNAVFRIQCPERVLAMDAQDYTVVVVNRKKSPLQAKESVFLQAVAGPNKTPVSQVAVFDIRNHQVPVKV